MRACSQWNFLRVNVLYDLATQFGVHPWHWYLTQGLPAVLGAHLPLALLGLALALRTPRHGPGASASAAFPFRSDAAGAAADASAADASTAGASRCAFLILYSYAVL